MSPCRALWALVLLASVALAEDRKVEVDLTDGSHLSGTLIDFGTRVYRFNVGGKVIEIPEDKVAEIRFQSPPVPKRSVEEIEAQLKDLLAQHRRLEDELAAAREKYTDRHPTVVDLQARLEAVERRYQEARRAVEDATAGHDAEKLQILRDAAKQTRALYEKGACSEMEVIRAEFLAAQWENHLGVMSDADFAKKCDEACARVKAIAEAALKSGAMSPAELAKIRLELIDSYKPLPKEPVRVPFEVPPQDSVGKLVTDAFYHRSGNRFELKPRWKADLKGLYGCAAFGSPGFSGVVFATTEEKKLYSINSAGVISCIGDHEPGLMHFVEPFDEIGGNGRSALVMLQNFMYGSFDVYSQDLTETWKWKRWTAEGTGGLNVPLVADLDDDGHVEIVAVAFGGRGVQVHAGVDGKIVWQTDEAVSGVCAVRRTREGKKERALVGYGFGKGVKVLGYRGRKEELWPVQGARCIASGDLDGDGDDEVIVGESAQGDFFGQENRVVARRGTDGAEIWAYNLPSGFGLREPNALWVGDLDGDGKAEVLVALSPGIMTREQEKTYDCFLCLLDSQGRPAWISEPFKDAGKMSVGSFCAGISLAELDGDGKRQVILGILEQGVRAYDVVH